MTREEMTAKVLADAPPSAKPALERAFSGAASPRAAIKAKCLECLNFDRKAIRACTGYSCPLWAYRPFQERKDADQGDTK